MALLRQLYSDAKWYAAGQFRYERPFYRSLERNKGLVQIFEAKDKGNALRADKIGDANGIQYAILGGGDEYESIAEIKGTTAQIYSPASTFRMRMMYPIRIQADYVTLGICAIGIKPHRIQKPWPMPAFHFRLRYMI